MSIYDFNALDIQGNDRKLSEFAGKVVLIVNTASKCGFTPQYEGLEEMYKELHDQGLEILAKAKFLGKLKRLHLKDNPIEGKGVVALFSSENLDSLSTFQINDGWTCKKREGWRYKPQT